MLLKHIRYCDTVLHNLRLLLIRRQATHVSCQYDRFYNRKLLILYWLLLLFGSVFRLIINITTLQTTVRPFLLNSIVDLFISRCYALEQTSAVCLFRAVEIFQRHRILFSWRHSLL